MNSERLQSLRIPSEAKERPRGAVWAIFIGVFVVAVITLFFAWPRASDSSRVLGKKKEMAAAAGGAATSGANTATQAATPAAPVPAATAEGTVLTVSGYIINRERIELSPRFMGVVKWIGVKKGDVVKKDQVVVRLDDAEYQARLSETKGRQAQLKVALEKARINHQRVAQLARDLVESKQLEDDARLGVASAEAALQEIDGQLAGIMNWIDWTVIRSPIDGVVLEKLVDPNELVTPQSFGGTRGPSTALIALADPKDLQVEIDLNEADVAKVFLDQKCRVSPEAYPDKVYEGYVAEKAPEANRQKGTLQIKVQIRNPDHFLTPELSAKVDFIGAAK